MKRPIEMRNGFKDPKRMKAIHEIGCVLCEALGKKQTSKTIAHHKTGGGLGLKVSDRLTAALCENHHTKGSDAIHHPAISVEKWEKRFYSQDELIFMTDKALEGVL